jgi:multidrug efflux pump subunit AcrA (membrane-fusion protein)
MKLLFSKKIWFYVVLFIVGVVAAWWYVLSTTPETEGGGNSVTVKHGVVSQIVVASGKTEAKDIAKLSFVVPGTIRQVYRSVGERVEEGEVIASLIDEAIVAEYNAALAQVRYLGEQKRELVDGARSEELTIAEARVRVAQANLDKISQEYDQAIRNAYQRLLSDGLEAHPTDPENNNDIPPSITGVYLCDTEGSYELSLYHSNTDSNLSYRLSGLETGLFQSNESTPEPLGKCGLYIQFDEAETYRSGSTWSVQVPNKRNPNYITLRNVYELLLTQRDVAIEVATKELRLAEEQQRFVQAPAKQASLAQADAAITQAEANLAMYVARIADYTVRAPFAGLVSEVDMKVGEVVDPRQTITVVAEATYEFKVQVPEIDVTKVAVGNQVEVIFDAEQDISIPGKVVFISPVSTSISGVSYYDTYVKLEVLPAWIREGLNADVYIEVVSKHDVLVLPKRYVVTEGQDSWVYQKRDGQVERINVEVGLVGSDDLVEVLNLPAGTVVELPV